MAEGTVQGRLSWYTAVRTGQDGMAQNGQSAGTQGSRWMITSPCVGWVCWIKSLDTLRHIMNVFQIPVAGQGQVKIDVVARS